MNNKNALSAWQLLNKKDPIQWLAVGFGSGLVPKAPGTFGTLAAIPFYFLMQDLGVLAYLIVLVISFAVGCYFCDKTSRDWKVHDHGAIVWDEFVGFWITMFLIPFDWKWVLIGFILFRFFDILKPWPIRYLDKQVEGGFGIMIDDVLAGVYAWICLFLIVKFYP